MIQEMVPYDEMCRAINVCYDIDPLKDIRNKALAMEMYFRQAKNPEPERRACEIRLRAERRSGEILREMDKAKGARGRGSNQYQVRSDATTAPQKTLADYGISKDQSSKWQQLAAVPKREFEAALAGPEKPSTVGIIGKRRGPMNPKALWLWGRMRDLENDGILSLDQESLINEMTEGMRADVVRLAPLIINWLEGIPHEKV